MCSKLGTVVIHEIRNFGPSCLNRDEFGMPKTGYLGGYNRGRISSQCKKRAICEYFRKEMRGVTLGTGTNSVHVGIETACSTRNLYVYVVDKLSNLIDPVTGSAVLDKNDAALMKELGSDKWFKSFSLGEQKDVMQKYSWQDLYDVLYCVYDRIHNTHDYVDSLSNEVKLNILEVKAATRKTFKTELDKEVYIKAHLTKLYSEFDSKKLKEKLAYNAKNRIVNLDIALFGRMSVLEAVTNVEAAMSVSHAMSVNKLRQEEDYFIAVDEATNSSGAGHANEKYFNSCCYYTYYSIDLDLLVSNLRLLDNNMGVDVALLIEDIKKVLNVICDVVPSGHQKDIASVVYPDLMMFEVIKSGMPISYINAFAKPVSATENSSLIQESVNTLLKEVSKWDASKGFNGNRYIFNPNNYNVPTMTNTMSDINFDHVVEEVVKNI